MSEEVKRPVQGGKRIPKKKVCQFCVDKATEIDYKDVAKLRKYITEKGKTCRSQDRNQLRCKP